MTAVGLFVVGTIGLIVCGAAYLRSMLADDDGLGNAVLAFFGALCSVSVAATGLMIMMRPAWP